jgi:hypothetical protein
MPGSDDLMAGLDELAGAREGYETAWAYWRSSVPETFVSPAWQKILARSGGKFRLNIAKVPVVALADRLKVTGSAAVNPAGEKDDDADLLLQQVWAQNKLRLQTKRLIRNTLIFGDSYWYIWPADSPEADAPAQRVRIAYNDPRTVRVMYDPDDELTIRSAIKSWQEHGQSRAIMLYPDRIERGWVLKPGAKTDDPAAWTREQLVDPETDKPVEMDVPVPARLGRVPIFHFRTDMPFGSPESADMWGAQDAVQKLASTLAYTAERAGLRDRYLLTEPNASLNGNSGDSPEWDDEEDADESSRDNSRQRSGAGDIQIWEGVKAAAEWSAADPQGFMDPADWFLRFAALTSRVSSRYADPGGQHPSGAALRVADAPEAAKTEDRQEFLDDELASAQEAALRLLGVEDPRVVVRWKPSGIVDDVDTWQIVAAKISAGVPVHVAIVDTGLYESDVVQQWLTDSQVEMDLARRIGLVAEMGGAVQQLSQGVALGLVPEDAARRLVEETIGQLVPDVTGDQPE